MDITALFDQTLDFIAANRLWAGVIFGLLAFGESMVVLGVLIPATGIMVAAGALVGAGRLPFVDLWIGGAIGAALGDALSYWIGHKLGPAAHRLWPFSAHPELLSAAERLFARWGWLAVVVGRFIGPLRASVPTVAGIAAMPNLPFQLANFGSAVLWIPVLVFPGTVGAWAWDMVMRGDVVGGTLLALVLVGASIAVYAGWRRLQPLLLEGRDRRP